MNLTYKNPLPTLILIASLFACGSVAAQPACPAVEPLDLSSVLLAPPCDSCTITKAELAELQALQASRTPEMAAHARADYTRTVERFLAGMNPPIEVKSVGAADRLFECAAKTAEDAVAKAKMKFHRTRPYALPDNGLQVLKRVTADDDPSFPSGHATFGAVTGLVLSDMVPELREKISARIEDFGFSRLVSGVHFRSDVYAGEISGAAAAAALLANGEFRSELEAAKPDLRKALGYSQ
jgi:acid phosphatase (class A)